MINGYRREKDIESRERWCIARKITWAIIQTNSKELIEEKDVIVFPWEKELIERVEREYDDNYLLELESTILFWKNYDNKKNNA